MKQLAALVLGAAVAISASAAHAVDQTWNYAVQITATVQAAPAQINLNWLQDTSGTPANYTVFRKAPSATSWGSPVTVLAGTTTNYTDANVTAGTAYEYQIVKDRSAAGYNGYGYVEAGIAVPLTDNPGTVELIVDKTYASNLSAELQQLQQDLAGDGWSVIRHDVARGDSVASVKNLIKNDYLANPSQVNTVFLFGHVPVPYSGLINPDGHDEHLGAWPADVYYGDMDGTWTDNTVNYQQTLNSDPADAARMSNVPGDGKFDQSTIPAVVKLQVGRVDLANMPGYLGYQSNPTFISEQELLRQYLNKDHRFRTGLLKVQRRSLIADYNGVKDQIAIAASGFRSFAPMVGVGDANLTNLNIIYNDEQGHFVSYLKDNDYLLALGCGAGSYNTISGLGTGQPYNFALDTDFVSNDIRAVFVMLFGSWTGDWDHQDDALRSILATPTYGLAAMYTGVPHWYLHPMGLGETLGYCTRLTQNNTNPGLYQSQVNLTTNLVHIALMGDPTLRLFTVVPVGSVSGAASGGNVTVNWTASSDTGLVGYHVYRSAGGAASGSAPFTRLTSTPTSALSYSDPGAPDGSVYMVRAVKLEVTASGSYYNASDGVVSSPVSNAVPPPPPPPTARLANLSVSTTAGTGNAVLAVGFVIGGSGTSGTLPLLVRGAGPALQGFGVSGVLPDPLLTLYQGSQQVATNDNWGSGSNAGAVATTASAVGAFAFPSSSSLDAALVGSYGTGLYSATITGVGGTTGVALAEVYDASAAGSGGAAGSTRRLTNLSARAQVNGTGGGAGSIFTIGFVVGGTGSETVLVRGVGPALAGFGVAGALPTPQVRLLAKDGTVIKTNSGWGGDAALAAIFTQVGAFNLDPASADSALVATLPAGNYSVQIVGGGGSSGIALAELYEVK
jgi:hypothetical protein